jgi:ADP-ribosylglycohydrolase
MAIWQGEGAGPPEEVTSLIKGALREDEGGPVQGAGNEAAVRSHPVGLWNHRQKAAIGKDCSVQSSVTHSDPRAASGASVIARAVALNTREGPMETLSFIDAITPSPDEAGGGELRTYLPQMPEWLRMKEDLSVADIARAGQEMYFGSTISRYVIPSVLISLYAFLRSPDDFCESLAVAYRAGGDVNSTGAMTGALAGARVGLQGIPEMLPGGLQEADDIRQIGLELLRVTEARESSP